MVTAGKQVADRASSMYVPAAARYYSQPLSAKERWSAFQAMKVKEESKKVGSKLNIQKTKFMASGPITSWEIDGETLETVSDFIFGGLQNHCTQVNLV